MSCEFFLSPFIRDLTGYTLRPGGLKTTKRAAEYCGFNSNFKVLDIGCGFGESLVFLKKRYGLCAFGVEPSSKMREKCAGKNPGLSVIEGDANHISYCDSFFDAVLIECVFSLVEEKLKALKEIKRVLKPNGFFIISDMYLQQNSQNKNPGFKSPCFSGAMFKPELDSLFAQSGFKSLLFEDHSDYLKDIAIKYILNGGSLKTLQTELGIKNNKDFAKPGYFLNVLKNIK